MATLHLLLPGGTAPVPMQVGQGQIAAFASLVPGSQQV